MQREYLLGTDPNEWMNGKDGMREVGLYHTEAWMEEVMTKCSFTSGRRYGGCFG